MRTVLLLALLAALVLAWRLGGLYGLDHDQMTGAGGASEAQRLFEAMSEQGLLTLDAQGRVTPAPADHVLAQRAAGVQDDAVLEQQQRLLQVYHYSAAGTGLDRWLELWNRGRELSAVRDDRPRSAGEQAPEWQAVDRWGGALEQFGRVPLELGYVLNGELRPGFGAWFAAPGASVEYRSTIRLTTPQTIRIQVIGVPDTSGLPLHRSLGCGREPTAGGDNCVHADPSDAYDAWQIHLRLAAGEHQLRLPVRAIGNPSPEDLGLPLALVDGKLVWRAGRESYGGTVAAARPPARFVVESADGVALTDEAGLGTPSAFTLEQGLAALVGHDRKQRGGLSGLLARSAISDLGADQGRVTLTLESRLQRIAQTELIQRIDEVKGNQDPYAERRRGALVVLDAANGDILAAAAHPTPPAGTRHWDRAAFALTWPDLDPFRFTPWQGLDAHATPGSTFKPVTALAAIQAAAENKEIEQMLEGWSRSRFARQTGLLPGQGCYQAEGASEVCNFRRGSLERSFVKGLRHPACDPKAPRSNSLGLREAVRDSLNIWFVRLAERMDRNNLASGGPDTHLYRQALSLGFGPPLGLFPEIGGVPRDRLDAAYRAHRGSVLKAQSGDLDLGYPKLGAARQRLAQNAFGQGVRASALQMARTAAAIARGELPTPTLLHAWEGKRVEPPEPQPLELDEDLLELLRQGMKAVPETGTAATAFGQIDPEGRCRTYGKTGTARTLKRPALYSGWLIGWREPPREGEREIAFACVMTHFSDSRTHTGGQLCGPLVARVLKAWEGNDAAE